MHHTPIGPDANRTAAEALMTHGAMAILVDDDPAIQAAGRRVRGVAEAQAQVEGDLVDAREARDNAVAVQHAVGGAHAALEVACEGAHGERGRDEVEGCGGGEARAVFGEEVEGGGPVGGVGGWWGEVEAEEGVVDGGFGGGVGCGL